MVGETTITLSSSRRMICACQGPNVKTTAYFAGKRRVCTGDWPAGVGCGGFGFAVQGLGMVVVVVVVGGGGVWLIRARARMVVVDV